MFLSLIQVCQAHEIDTRNGISCKLLDNLQAPISDELLIPMIRQYAQDCRFFLELQLESPDEFAMKVEVRNWPVVAIA